MCLVTMVFGCRVVVETGQGCLKFGEEKWLFHRDVSDAVSLTSDGYSVNTTEMPLVERCCIESINFSRYRRAD